LFPSLLFDLFSLLFHGSSRSARRSLEKKRSPNVFGEERKGCGGFKEKKRTPNGQLRSRSLRIRNVSLFSKSNFNLL
jgi:hypothetical protein